MLSKHFFDHPNRVCMTYFEHMRFSLNLSRMLLAASAKAVAHAFVPSTFITSTSATVRELADLLERSGCAKGSKGS